MQETRDNSKRIAKNTLLLYFRMLFMMLVSLYTSRIILNTLGVEDFGIYNVVGGVVAMFSVFSGSLSAAISRFITYELGTGNIEKLKKIFSTSIIIQIIIATIIFVISETVGVWFLNSKMNIPIERMVAANWVFQFSIITFVINLISVPYNADIIAHERMEAFAYISIIEAMGKLAVAFCIAVSPMDNLIFYGLLLMLIAIFVRLLYGWYCKRHFDESTFNYHLDQEIIKQMFSFAGWNFIGSGATILRDQGGNIVINLFCGPTVNAARGIAVQVNSAIYSFAQNFMTALNPQITKSYANGNSEYMIKLIQQGARLSFYMLLLLSLPVLINTDYILKLWLKQVPEHSVLFVQLILIFAMHESLANPLITAMLATGDIKKYQILAGGLNMLNLPVCYIFLRGGAAPELVFITAIFFSVVVQIVRLILLRNMIGLDIYNYIKQVYANVLPVSIISASIPILFNYFTTLNPILKFLLSILITFLWTTIVVLYIGCKKQERKFVFQKSKRIVSKIYN